MSRISDPDSENNRYQLLERSLSRYQNNQSVVRSHLEFKSEFLL